MFRRQIEIFACLALSTAGLASAQSLQPGEYEVAVEMRVPGGAPHTSTERDCVTPEAARDFTVFLEQAIEADGDCTHSNLKTTGNKVTWDTTCDGSTSSTELTTSGDTFTVFVTTKIGGETFTANMLAKRVGATCTGEEDE